MKIFYFTSTGNSLDLAKHFDAELHSIPKALKENNLHVEDDKIGFIYPTYGGSAPSIVVEFLNKVTINSPYIFVITTYGGSQMGSLNHFLNTAKKNNIKINYANSLLTYDNYVKMYDMDKVINDHNDEVIENNISIMVKEIKNNCDKLSLSNSFIGVGSNITYGAMQLISKLNSKWLTVEESCNLCGTCAKVCPTKNIAINGKVSIGKNCISCYGCTHNCPSNSIRVKGEKSKTRYRNNNVSLKEIIEANNQM